ncbi:hypothetical protein ACIQVK_18660 [Streptomyces sp. NPDC090493]|uniref:8-oxoguanine DNA glycosylase OGG fold protein n=1 Tax=Streptomyces sp. NPDC090493 TaxID=3365964 RepID=UPI003827EEC5
MPGQALKSTGEEPHPIDIAHARGPLVAASLPQEAEAIAGGTAGAGRAEVLDAALATAVTALREHGSREAYAALHRHIPGFGPSFFTKFLYFTGTTLAPAHGPRPLILDRVLSRRLRMLAAAVGRDTGQDPDGSLAAWVWADGNWSAHRYGVYLSFLHSAARQLAAGGGWPSGAGPDLLECALFGSPPSCLRADGVGSAPPHDSSTSGRGRR